MTDRLDRWADPPLLVLASLADEPKHGYAITQDVAETMGVRLSAGTLYAVIARLEARGLIEPLESDDRRRPYRVAIARRGAGAAVRADEQGRIGGQGAAERQARLGRSMSASGLARDDAPVPGRARALPAVLAGPLRRRGPGPPRRLRRWPGRRRQRRLARGARLGQPARAPARPGRAGCDPAWPRPCWPGPC